MRDAVRPHCMGAGDCGDANGVKGLVAARPELENGGTQIRTGDTTIFSRVLYQLSYPAGARER